MFQVGAHSSIVEASFRALVDGLEFGIVNCSQVSVYYFIGIRIACAEIQMKLFETLMGILWNIRMDAV